MPSVNCRSGRTTGSSSAWARSARRPASAPSASPSRSRPCGTSPRRRWTGAFGMSTGYFPDFVTTDEIASVARPIAQAGGVYATHMRSGRRAARRHRRDHQHLRAVRLPGRSRTSSAGEHARGAGPRRRWNDRRGPRPRPRPHRRPLPLPRLIQRRRQHRPVASRSRPGSVARLSICVMQTSLTMCAPGIEGLPRGS